jgi:hypothetical protein
MSLGVRGAATVLVGADDGSVAVGEPSDVED